MTWLHETHASVADTVEIVALTKTDPALAPGPGAAGHRRRAGRRRRRGGRRAGAVPHLPRPRPRAASSLDAVPTTIDEQRKRQLHDNPEGHRWAVDNAWLSGPAVVGRAGDAPRLHHPAEREGVHDLVQHGAAAGPARHGVLAAVGDLPGVVRRVGVARRRRALHRVAGVGDGRPGAGDRRPVPRRQRPVPPPGAVHVRRELGRGCRRSAPSGTPTACSSATSPGPTARPTATTGSPSPLVEE